MQADLAAPTPPCRAVENQPVKAQFKTGLDIEMCSGRGALSSARSGGHRALTARRQTLRGAGGVVNESSMSLLGGSWDTMQKRPTDAVPRLIVGH